MILFKRKRQEEQGREIDLKSLYDLIDDKIEEYSKNAIDDARRIIKDINAVLRSISSIGKDINAIKLDKHDLAPQYITAMKNAKRNLLMVMNSINTNLSIDSIKDLDDTNKKINSILSRLGDVAGSHRRTIYTLFPSQAKRLKSELMRLKEYNDRLSSIVKDYHDKVDRLDEIRGMIADIIDSKGMIDEIEKENDELNDSISSLKEEKDRISKEIDEIANDEEYKKAKAMLDRLNKEYSSLKDSISQSFSSITRVISKYDYSIGLDRASKDAIDKIMLDASNIADIDTSSLKVTLSKMINAINSNKIHLKNADKDISNIKHLMDNLEYYSYKVKEYKDEIGFISSKLKPLSLGEERLREKLKIICREIDDLSNKIERNKDRIDEFKAKIDEHKDRIMLMLKAIMMDVKIKD